MNDDAVVLQGIDDVAAIEQEFSLPRGFIDSLLREDEWTLVIKCHALLESATSRLLTLFFGKSCLNDIFTRMELSNRQTGKAAFISQLSLLDRPQRTFISRLSELRNQLVHNASNTCLSLPELLASMPSQRRNEYVSGLNIRLQSIQINGNKVCGNDLVLNYTKYVIWASTVVCLSDIWAQSVFAVKRNQLIARALKGMREIEIDPIMVSLSLDSLPKP